jgi:DNA-binding beta-propeller fold protein YncE
MGRMTPERRIAMRTLLLAGAAAIGLFTGSAGTGLFTGSAGIALLTGSAGIALFTGSAGLGLLAHPAAAEVIISANDAKVTLRNGVATNVTNPVPDSITVMDVTGDQVRVRGQVEVPTSVVGPPLSVAISPDEKLALVTANQVPDPQDASKLVNGNFMTVVSLDGTPQALGRVTTGAGPAGVSFSPDGKLALVANRGEGTVGVYRVRGQEVTQIGKVELGNAASLVSHAAFTPDGKHALVTRYGDSRVSVLDIDGENVTKSQREITTGVSPYAVNVTNDGKWAVVANMGGGQGDTDTVALIDLQHQPYRVVDILAVGQTPEGMQLSPDNRHVAVTVMNGSNKPDNSPFHGPGQLKVLRIENGHLRLLSTTPIGTWAQGAAFSRDGKLLLAGNMIEHNIQVFRVGENGKLTPVGRPIQVFGGSAALRSSANR